MNGAHDLGGMQGFGAVDPEPEASESLFHAPWERRAFAITLACGMLGRWTLDQTRHARERQHPRTYLSNSYYETWLAGLTTLLSETGLLAAGELAAGKPARRADVTPPDAEKARALLAKGGPTLMDPAGAPRFAVGDRVRVRNLHPNGHIRVPRYVRGRPGQIHAYHGVHVFADLNAHGRREGQPLYSVRFSARELWGPDASPRDTVFVDLWEPHLERP